MAPQHWGGYTLNHGYDVLNCFEETYKNIFAFSISFLPQELDFTLALAPERLIYCSMEF